MIEGIAGHHETLPPWEDIVEKAGRRKLFFMEAMDEDGDGLLKKKSL